MQIINPEHVISAVRCCGGGTVVGLCIRRCHQVSNGILHACRTSDWSLEKKRQAGHGHVQVETSPADLHMRAPSEVISQAGVAHVWGRHVMARWMTRFCILNICCSSGCRASGRWVSFSCRCSFSIRTSGHVSVLEVQALLVGQRKGTDLIINEI